jgi:hypothetical protein
MEEKDEAILILKEQPQRKSIFRKAVSIGDTGCLKNTTKEYAPQRPNLSYR